jgi:MFS family permease
VDGRLDWDWPYGLDALLKTPMANVDSPIPRGALAVLLAASSLTVLAGAVIAPGIPGVVRAFSEVPGAAIQGRLLLTLPALAVALSASLSGQAIDRLGARRVLMVALALYGLAGTTGLWLTTLPALLVGRFVLGLAVGGVMTSATRLLDGLAGEAGRSRVLGWQAAFMGLGGLAFLTLGGWLADLSWRGPFAVYVVAWVLVPLVALYVAYVAPEARTAHEEAVPSAVTGMAVAALLGMVLFYAAPVQVPFLLSERFAASGTVVGAALGAMTLTSATASFLFARAVNRFGRPAVLRLTYLAMSVGFFAIGLAPTLWVAVLGLIAVGAGTGLLLPNLASWVGQVTPPAARGRALGRYASGMFLGQFLSPLVLAPGLAFGMSIGTALVALSVVALLAALATRWWTYRW